jgi:transposase-like protein
MKAACWEVDMWAARVAERADLPDERLNQRLADILATFARKSHDSIPQACSTAAACKATCRFFSNHRVNDLGQLILAVVNARLH